MKNKITEKQKSDLFEAACKVRKVELAPNAILIFTDLQQKKEIVTTINELLPYSWSNPTLTS